MEKKEPKERVTITIDKKLWKRLSMIKLKEDIRNFDEVITKLLEEYE